MTSLLITPEESVYLLLTINYKENEYIELNALEIFVILHLNNMNSIKVVTTLNATDIGINARAANPYLIYLSTISKFYLWGYLTSFILGFVGNISGLLTFSRVMLRKISTGCLFIVLAISDTIYLLVSIIDFVEYGLGVIIIIFIRFERMNLKFFYYRSHSMVLLITVFSVNFVILSHLRLNFARLGPLL